MMSTTNTLQTICPDGVAGGPVPWKTRRVELAELALVVSAALLVQVLTRHGTETGLVAYLASQIALPLGAALTLRRSVGRRAFAAAAIMSCGLVAAVAGAIYLGMSDVQPTNAYVAAGMVWVLASDPRTPVRATVVGSSFLAAAMAVSALI